MAKFNRTGLVPERPTSVIGMTAQAIPTHEGAAGYARPEKAELFLLAVAGSVGEDTFYEDAKGRNTRFRDLVRAVISKDPQWVANLALWLRREAGMRSAPILIAAEYVWFRKNHFLTCKSGAPHDARDFFTAAPTPSELITAVCLRADEPGELLAYWLAAYGRPLPQSLKRGLGRAALNLYNEYTVGGWDSSRSPVRYADVVELSRINRAAPTAEHDRLFKFLLDDRRGRGSVEGLPRLEARKRILSAPNGDRAALLAHDDFVRQARYAGLTWQDLSGWVPSMDKQAWIIASQLMGYSGLLKNLNNFSRADLSDIEKLRIAQRLIAPEQVKRSGVLPMAFLSAYLNVVDDYWKPVINDALKSSLESIPQLPGRTLILIDTSGSMAAEYRPAGLRKMPGAEHLKRWDVAALFGVALAQRCQKADIVAFADQSAEFEMRRGESTLRAVERFKKTHLFGTGTWTKSAVDRWYSGHSRVVCLTDEQNGGWPTYTWARRTNIDVYGVIPDQVPVHTFNLEGYKPTQAESGKKRFTAGGLSDQAFKTISYTEAGFGHLWPWEQPA